MVYTVIKIRKGEHPERKRRDNMTNEQKEQLFREIIELEEAICKDKHDEREIKQIRENIEHASVGGKNEKMSWVLLPQFNRYSKNFRTIGIVSGWWNVLDIRNMKIKTVHKGKLIEEYDWEDRFGVFREEISMN